MLSSLLVFAPGILVALLARSAVLVDFQVANPPPVPKDAQQCTVQLIEHTFGNSFGAPAIVTVTPPTDCGEPGSWAAITLNLTVTSNGTQFDRLGTFTFQDVEIWRTSTPEPTAGGIIWTYVKDVTRYTPLFAKEGTMIFQLDNLLTANLTGQYASTVSATYYASSATNPPAGKSDVIIPLATLSNDSTATGSVPPGFSTNVNVPRNAVQIYAELYASGNGNEEFWYFNTANQFLDDLPNGTTFGDGPFREVRILVDGQFAGAAFPYATIFTGGIVPTAWRPITSYGALDLPTYFLDLTPFVPILTDGNSHNITLDVASAEDDHAINQNWFVSGNLQVVTDPSGQPTTGNITTYNASPFANASTTGSVGDNGDVNVTVTATRTVRIEADIVSGSGKTSHVVFSQDLTYSNVQNYLQNTSIQNVFQTATGKVSSTLDGVTTLTDSFSFPLNINFTILNANGSQFMADFDHSYDRDLLPSPFILGSTIKERQLAGGFFQTASTGNSGTNGTSNNTLSYTDTKGNTYDREVNARLNNITFDHQGGSLAPAPQPSGGAVQAPMTIAGARLPGGRTAGPSD